MQGERVRESRGIRVSRSSPLSSAGAAMGLGCLDQKHTHCPLWDSNSQYLDHDSAALTTRLCVSTHQHIWGHLTVIPVCSQLSFMLGRIDNGLVVPNQKYREGNQPVQSQSDAQQSLKARTCVLQHCPGETSPLLTVLLGSWYWWTFVSASASWHYAFYWQSDTFEDGQELMLFITLEYWGSLHSLLQMKLICPLWGEGTGDNLLYRLHLYLWLKVRNQNTHAGSGNSQRNLVYLLQTMLHFRMM